MKKGNGILRFFGFNLQFFIVLILISFLSIGCGDDGSSSSSSSSSTVSGVASKGPIADGTVSAYKIIDGQKGGILGTATSSEDGSYSIDIGSYTGPVLIEITGGTYKDEATETDIVLTMPLRAAIGNASGEVSVAVTPLTELAVRKAEPGGLTPDKIDSSNKQISQLLGGDGSQDLITQILPVDVTDEAACNDANNDQKEYGLLLAALSQMSKEDTSKNIEDIINEIEEDLDDDITNVTGGALLGALNGFLGSPNNHTDMGANDIKLDECIADATTEGLPPTGSLADAKKYLADFLNDPTEDNYNIFMNYMTSVPDSKDAHLFKAIATLFDIYSSDAVSFITDNTGLDINFSTNFDELMSEDVIYEFLMLSSYDEDTKGLLADIETRLDDVDEDLELAEGVNAAISLTGFDTVYFDDVDVTVLRTIAKALRTVCAYVQAVDFSITDWNVTAVSGVTLNVTAVNGVTLVDIRDLIKDDTTEITDAQEDEFWSKNPKWLQYSDISKLDDFKTAFEAAADQFSSAVNALDALGESGRKARYKNAFNLDSEFDLWMTKAIAEETLPSILAAFDNSTEEIIVIDEEEISEKYIDGGDGYYYWQGTYNINLKYCEPADDNITIYDIASGDNFPRDVLDAAMEAKDNDEDYKPYVLLEETTSYKENATEMDWDDPVDTYTVPLATAITIDGDAGDWDSVSTFYDDGNTKVKLARDAEDNFYLYVSKPEGFEVQENEYYYGVNKWIPRGDEENYFSISLSFSWDGEDSFFVGAGTHDSISGWNEAEACETIQSKGIVGAEVKYSDSTFHRLTEAGSMNGWWSWYADDVNYHKQIKLLPEAGK